MARERGRNPPYTHADAATPQRFWAALLLPLVSGNIVRDDEKLVTSAERAPG